MTTADELPLDPRDVDLESEHFKNRICEIATSVACLPYDAVAIDSESFFARHVTTKSRLESIFVDPDWSACARPSRSQLIPLSDDSRLWLLSSKHKDHQDDDALKIDLAQGELERWEIYCRDPLLVRSYFGAIVGFVRRETTLSELLIVDGESGWD